MSERGLATAEKRERGMSKLVPECGVILYIMTAQRRASPHNEFLIPASVRAVLAFDISVLLIRSAFPFCCGVYDGGSSRSIPYSSQ